MKKIILILGVFLYVKSFAIIPVTDLGAIEQLITSTANQAAMIDNQYQMLKGITQGGIHVSDFTGTINKIKYLSDDGLAVSYATKDINTKFDKVFGDEEPSADQQKTQNQSMLDSALNTFKTASQQLSYVQQQANAVKDITTSSNAATGALAVAQGTNQLINSTNSQLQSLTAMTAQANSLLATQTAEKAATNKAINKERGIAFAFADTYHPYQDNPDFENIPNFNTGV